MKLSSREMTEFAVKTDTTEAQRHRQQIRNSAISIVMKSMGYRQQKDFSPRDWALVEAHEKKMIAQAEGTTRGRGNLPIDMGVNGRSFK